MSIKTYFQYLFHEIIDNVGMKQQRQQKQTLRDKKARLLVGPVNLFKNIPINYQKLRVKVVFLVYSEKFLSRRSQFFPGLSGSPDIRASAIRCLSLQYYVVYSYSHLCDRDD